MKRLIKFYNQFSDNGFSDCGTKYEILPYLVDDNAGNKELIKLANNLGFKRLGNIKKLETKGYRGNKMSHMVKIDETHKDGWGDEKQYYLGFIKLSMPDERYYKRLEPSVETKQKMSDEQAQEIINGQLYGVEDVVEMVNDNDVYIIMSGWNYFHEIELLGYDLEYFQELVGANDRTFHDEVFRCSDCGASDWNDSGYTYNYRIINSEILGLNCGCAHEAMKDLDNYANDCDNAIEREVANELVEENKIEVLETFIGGMVDGRGGYINGESVREGHPSGILDEYSEKYPNDEFVFIHEESGQFQSYFSIARIKKHLELVG